jgi:hypothetical protein
VIETIQAPFFVIELIAIVGLVSGVIAFGILCTELAPLLRWMDRHHGGWREELRHKK